MPPVVPKLRIPLEMGEGGFRTVEQDTDEEVAACVYAVLATDRGTLIDDPDFGVVDPTFDVLPIDTTEWLAQLGEYEPRAEVETSQEIEDLVANVLVEVGTR